MSERDLSTVIKANNRGVACLMAARKKNLLATRPGAEENQAASLFASARRGFLAALRLMTRVRVASKHNHDSSIMSSDTTNSNRTAHKSSASTTEPNRRSPTSMRTLVLTNRKAAAHHRRPDVSGTEKGAQKLESHQRHPQTDASSERSSRNTPSARPSFRRSVNDSAASAEQGFERAAVAHATISEGTACSAIYQCSKPIRLVRANTSSKTCSSDNPGSGCGQSPDGARFANAAAAIMFNLALSLDMLSSISSNNAAQAVSYRRAATEMYVLALKFIHERSLVPASPVVTPPISPSCSRGEETATQQGDNATPRRKPRSIPNYFLDISILNNIIVLYLAADDVGSARRIFGRLVLRINQVDQQQSPRGDLKGIVGNVALWKTLFHGAPQAAAA